MTCDIIILKMDNKEDVAEAVCSPCGSSVEDAVDACVTQRQPNGDGVHFLGVRPDEVNKRWEGVIKDLVACMMGPDR